MTTPRDVRATSGLESQQISVSTSILLTLQEAAVLLSVPESWLRSRVASHAIACTRLGRHIRFTRQQLEEIVTAGEQPAARAPLTGLTRRSRRSA